MENKIKATIKNSPSLDKDFIPFAAYMAAFRKSVTEKGAKKLAIAIERDHGLTAVYETDIHGTREYRREDYLFIERMVKFLLWMKGGFRVTICGDREIGSLLRKEYSKDGKRAFDAEFMENAYKVPFEVLTVPYEQKPTVCEMGRKISTDLTGCRIGFDAGGSDRKVAAVIDGKIVFSEEVVWHPKLQSDPRYHYEGILSAFTAAAAHMPRVDAIGVSSAGIYINNLCNVASLFIKVSKEDFKKYVRDIYIRAAGEIGNVPLVVCNDGDVAALSGAIDIKSYNILGIAMGTSEAAGYVDKQGCITGWLNELAFAPVDLSPQGALDEWSKDIGCGVKYLSQDSAIRLAGRAGIALDEKMPPAEKLKTVQGLMEKNDERAAEVFKSLGIYLGHSLALYKIMYDMEHVMLLGRVMSGTGGDIVLRQAEKVLTEDYPDIYTHIKLHLPDEKSRRVGQAAAAAYLPQYRNPSK